MDIDHPNPVIHKGNNMTTAEIVQSLPEAKGAIIVLSGGLDSTVAMRLAVERYGAPNVSAVSFFYGQRQSEELNRAVQSTIKLGVAHKIIDLSFMADINAGFSANTDAGMVMPTIQDVIGDPAPSTYVANRNMIMMSIAAAVAETAGVDIVICGLQSNDNYNYHDTTPVWLGKMNSILDENRKNAIRIIAPFVSLSKVEEIKAVIDLDGDVELLRRTLTCYNPSQPDGNGHYGGDSCGVCPSCAERLAAFAKLGITDPVKYQEQK